MITESVSQDMQSEVYILKGGPPLCQSTHLDIQKVVIYLSFLVALYLECTQDRAVLTSMVILYCVTVPSGNLFFHCPCN